MKLHYQTYFESVNPDDVDESVIVIIPGLFGATGNWRSFAKNLSKHRPVIVIDQRNHGQSPHSPHNSYFDCVSDLLELIGDLGLEKVSLCGHSMGGKTAMVFALTHPSKLDELVILDIAPVEYEHSHAPILEALGQVDLASAQSRSDVEKQLASAITDKSTRMFIMLSLAGRQGAFYWRLNIDGLYENLPLIGGFPSEVLQGTAYTHPCLFVKGALSNYIQDSHLDEINSYFPQSKLNIVENAGHWLHVDQQQEVISLILDFLSKEQKF